LAKKKEMFGMNERTYLSFEYSNRVNKPNSCTTTKNPKKKKKKGFCSFLKSAKMSSAFRFFFFEGDEKDSTLNHHSKYP
jgi:hypothetical protein